MTPKANIRTIADRARAVFEANGAAVIDAEILQPGAELLDLYGENIRARAYVVQDPVRGEMMLRPDFTIPVLRAHAAEGRNSARYTYCGEVFRVPEEGSDRAAEYLQVGYELVGDEDAAAADAEVFVRLQEALNGVPLAPVMGDMGLLRAAIDGLDTTEARKDALRRHLWRPRRFRALIERFAAPFLLRTASLEDAPEIGKRRAAEVAARLESLAREAETAPMTAGDVALLDDLLALKETAPNALSRLRTLAVDAPLLGPAIATLERRLDALATRGVDASTLPFEASFGRTTLEYYDGFVFGFTAAGRPDLPPLATGGRYDALAARLSNGVTTRAVGGVIRPEFALGLEGVV